MTTKPARSRTRQRDPHSDESGEPRRDLAKYATLLATSPLVRGGAAAEPYARQMFGDDVLFNEYLAELRKQTDAIVAGDLSGVETMLATQANTLDMIFNQLARKAASCEYLNQFQVHLSLALKAQAQSRATLEALAEIKNPRPVAFVKQANIANGPQQVNNGANGDAPPESRAREKNGGTTDELLTDERDGQTMDGGTASKAGRSNPAMATVGKLDGAAK